MELAQELPLPDDELKSELEMAQELPLPDDNDIEIEEETHGEGIYTQKKRETRTRYHKGGNMVVWSLIFQNYKDI